MDYFLVFVGHPSILGVEMCEREEQKDRDGFQGIWE